MIQRLKFGGDLAYARTLGKLMAFDLARRGLQRAGVLIPVPLHPSRLVARRFNQAVELARPVATRLGMSLQRTACERIRATAEQSRLDAPARRRNVRTAFAVPGRLDGADVVLLDDVMTTGSTLDALARVLKRAAHGRVAVWVCARAAAPRR